MRDDSLFAKLHYSCFRLVDRILGKTQVIKSDYLNHIDGIRAIAVLGVILFHTNSKWLPGGFIGVDIFFVISGYLISSIIYKKTLVSDFSLINFYVKRVRRILPLLIVVVVFTFPIAWLLLLPDEMRSYAKSMFSSLLMYSNQQFVSEAGYFDTQSHLKPLLHTWSLSIEAQFYLLFPLIFVLLLKFTKHPVYFIAFLTFISFFYADRATLFNSENSFFYFFARAWEMLSGCLVMLLGNQLNRNCRYGLMAQIFSIMGLALVLYSFLFLNKMMLHPGKVTLIPILGTSLLILFATKKTLVGRFLTTSIMAGVGLISYSLYLWHQPIIAFAKLAPNELSIVHWMMAYLLIATLSVLSWRYIEVPFRSENFIRTPMLIALVGAIVPITLTVSIWGYQSNGFFQQRFSKDNISLLEDLDGDRYRTFLFKHLYANEVIKSKFKKSDQPRILIVGDSYAADFINMVIFNNYFSKYQIKSLYIPARCQFYMGDNKYRDLIDDRDKKLCEQAQMKLNLLKQNIDKVDQIIFAFDWKPWAAEHINESITALNYQGSKKLIFIGSKRFLVDKRKILLVEKAKLAEYTSERSTSVWRVNKILAKNLKSHIFIDQDEIFCGKLNQCPLFTDGLHPISIDGSHLTPEGAVFLGNILFKHPKLSALNNQH